MAETILEIEELRRLDASRDLIRIPPETDVPLTPRVRRLVDTSAFRRLARISQLGLVSLVYPAAHHSRFEHSLGVYRTALLYLQQLAQDPQFAANVSVAAAERFIVAALLHDIGHWPFCHPIEDIRQPGIPKHESFASEFINGDEIASLLDRDWNLHSDQITSLLNGNATDDDAPLLTSLLSGPIDVDKMDYLARDSLHAGVPYGRNYDRTRLIGSLCLSQSGNALAITDKGRTAAEMMVFARYVMFSEVYWHHTVRSATAMLQRAFYALSDLLDVDRLFRETEQPMIDSLLRASRDTGVEDLLQGLFGPQRKLYKRLAQFSLFQRPDVYQRLARRPYDWLVRCTHVLSQNLAAEMGEDVAPEDVLIDAPPVKREIEVKIDVYFPKEDHYRSLSDVSPVVHTLAREQFDDYVKRVRIFVAPRLQKKASDITDMPQLLHRTIDELE